jgi:hypothetical protein
VTRHLVVIGAQRCGTTYLHDLLAAHPEVAMARPARPEPKVFLSEDLASRGRAWYVETYFSHAGDARVLGEKSTSYLDLPAAAERIDRVLGDPLVLVQLRDPVERAVSHWAFSTANGLEERDLATALTHELEHGPPEWDRARSSVSPYAYLARGRFTDQLVPWVERYGDRLRVQLLEDLVASPNAVGELYAWLGVDPAVRPTALGTPVNTSDRPASQTVGEGLLARLRDHFAESDAELAALLGRPLPWHDPERTS